MHFSASCSLTQPLLDCILYLQLTQYPYDPGTLPSSANQCIFGNMYLRSNLSRKHRAPEAAYLLGILCGTPLPMEGLQVNVCRPSFINLLGIVRHVVLAILEALQTSPPCEHS